MTIWAPRLEAGQSRYLAIADAIARDVHSGVLSPGERLPTHRDLAKALGVTVGTVSRGFAEAERRGLTQGEVGRGTYVRNRASVASVPAAWQDGLSTAAAEQATLAHGSVDLTLSLPVTLPGEGELLARTLRELADDESVVELLGYRQESGSHRQRALAARWLSRLDLHRPAEDILITAGSQHGLNVVFSSLFAPGDVLLTEAVTYPSIKSQARAFGVRLRGVEMDDQGAIPESIERWCHKTPKPTAIYLVPTLQNPTVAMMSQTRRREIIQVAERNGLWIIEDDVHAFLPEEPSIPMAALAPERTVYLASVAKCLAPGLRTGYLLTPPALRSRHLAGIHTTLWMAPPLTVELTSRWLEDGTADELIRRKRQATAERQQRAKELLSDLPSGTVLHSHPAAYHLWLELPEPWCADDLVLQARERGVHLLGAGVFAVSRRNVPHALRLSIGVPTTDQLDRALRMLAELIHGGGAPCY